MSKRLWFLLAPMCALSACSTSSEDGPPVGRPLISAQSYMVHGRLTLTPVPPGSLQPRAYLPTEHDFVLRVDPTGETSIAGGPGEAAKSALASPDGVAFRAVDGFSLDLRGASCGSQVTYSDFRFTAGVDALAGTATGAASIQEGDIVFPHQATLEFTGLPDTTRPVLSVLSSPTDHDPLLPLVLRGSEPLPAETKAQLVASTDLVDLVPVSPQGTGVATAFDKPDVALRYGTRYALVVSPWTDLAGNPGENPGEVVTAGPPPLASEDGFESATQEIGGAAVLRGDVLPPISGQQSAFIASASDADARLAGGSRQLTVRLAVSPGDRFVRFSLRPLSHFSGEVGTYDLTIRLAVPGKPIAHVAVPSREQVSVPQTVEGGGSVWFGDIRTVEVPLPAGVADEVVFDFRTNALTFACGLQVATASYQIDDLRVE
jgi:hypothetical protein